MNLDFLNEINLVETPEKARTSRGPQVDHTPAEGATFRLFSDGRIYPSQEFVDTHNLEYVNKGEEVGNGLDIIDTINFPNYPEGAPRLVMVALTSKDNKKVDLFGSVGYNEDDTPKRSVTEQGSSTTGKWLIPMLEEVYGITLFPEGVKFVDLVVNTQFGLETTNGIYLMPKVVARGERKGEITYERRTNTKLWPLTVYEVEDMTEEMEEEETVNESIL